jgi:hypothetical protein
MVAVKARATAIALSATTLAACGSAQGHSQTAFLPAARAPAASAPAPARTAASRAPHGSTNAAPIAGPPCGTATAETLAGTEGAVARRIYANELASSEVFADRRQVESFGPLLSALALRHPSPAHVREAVTSLVFSHTHVVRLRVTQGGAVLADVGGPHILAPVSGELRFHGRTVGRYALSVQDDLGYVKLVSRFIGVRLVLREGARTIAGVGALAPWPSSLPAHGPVSYRGARYEAYSFDARSFPGGPLRISLLVPVARGLAAGACAQIKIAELGDVARRVSRRFSLSPANFSSYIKATAPLTGGLIYVRSGSRQLAGSTHPGPGQLPDRGTVRYRGLLYGVSSFAAPTEVGQVRIYQLVRL